MVGNHSDMKCIDGRRSRQNRFFENRFGDVQDGVLDGEDGDARQRLESVMSERGITISCLVKHVL